MHVAVHGGVEQLQLRTVQGGERGILATQRGARQGGQVGTFQTVSRPELLDVPVG